ncbi:hypothetical protein [Oceanobacillus profundus]|uniref:hypothetical protein n=1 Tax=Oceanobacillus profundus TaxID=372463 RepID=UPI00267E3F95|nr:hypothetical protein [Oceanobacillus profundus]
MRRMHGREAEENTVGEQTELFTDTEKPKVVLMDTIQELERIIVTIGSEIGDTCPVCRTDSVEEIGGCNTCTSCGAQLKCGL